MKTGMQKCSFFDDATGTVVQLNDVSEEGEIKIKEPLASKDADGGERFAGHHSRLEITAFDDAGYDQLKTWMDDETPLKFVSYGLEGHILWYRETKITVKKNLYVPPGKNNSFTVVMEQKGGDHSGFDGNQIWYGKNLLYGAAGWEDGNSNGVVDNYTIGAISGSIDLTFVGEQEISSPTSSTMYFYSSKLIFPISNANIDSFALYGAANTYNGVAAIEAKDFAVGMISSGVCAFDAVAQFITPPNTHYLYLSPIAYGSQIDIGDIFAVSSMFAGVSDNRTLIKH